MELDGGLENDCGCTFIATVEAFSILLTTDFISTQQKLSSVFTMESDCPERIGQMEHFKTLTIKRREINRDFETNTKTRNKDKGQTQRTKTKGKDIGQRQRTNGTFQKLDFQAGENQQRP